MARGSRSAHRLEKSEIVGLVLDVAGQVKFDLFVERNQCAKSLNPFVGNLIQCLLDGGPEIVSLNVRPSEPRF